MKTIILTNDIDPKCVYVGLTDMPLRKGDLVTINKLVTTKPSRVVSVDYIMEDECRQVTLEDSYMYIGVDPIANRNEWLDFMKGNRHADLTLVTPESIGVPFSVGNDLARLLSDVEELLDVTEGEAALIEVQADTLNPVIRAGIERVLNNVAMFSPADIHTLRYCVLISTQEKKDHHLYKKLTNLI